MIALCLTHHRQADAGAFTSEQLRQFKAGDNANEVRGRLEWMRQSLLAVVGGSFYYEVPKVIQLGGRPLVWFERDEHGYMLLGVRLPTLSGQPRVRVTRNFFEHIGTPEDFECPPNGRLLRVRYADGDSLAIEFLNCESTEAFRERYQQPLAWNDVAFPLTLLEINLNIAGRRLTFTPDGAEIMGNRLVRGWSRNSNVGISLD